MAAQRAQQIALARTLPPRLLTFFRKFPPPAILQATSIAAKDPAASTATTTETATATTEPSSTAVSQSPNLPYANPFLPTKNFRTGTWRGPIYGLRQQADLCKLAREHGVEDLLPHSIKKSGERERRRLERGLRVKGTGVGERVKGHAWERTLRPKLEKRKEAMLKMPEMVEQWKQVSFFVECWYGEGRVFG
jgi:large subunit ribosomal protein L25